MIIVHHLNNSRSQRVLWLLEELGLPYTVKRYERDPVTMRAPAALQQVHPLGKSPVIEDNGVVIAETGAIVEYLTDVYDTAHKLVPPAGSAAKRAYTYWLHYAEGSAMPLLLLKLVFMRMPKSVPALLRPLVNMIAAKAQQSVTDPQLKIHLEFCADALKRNGGWFAGSDFSAADIMMSFPLEAAASRLSLDRPDYRPIQDFLARIHARPAYHRALEQGGPYELLK